MKLNPSHFLLAIAATALLALTAVLPARADYSNTVMSLKPVAYWRLNESAVPAVNYGVGTATNRGALGPAANGTYYHSSTAQQPGAVAGNPGVLFNGSSQYVEVPYSPVLNTNGPFSVEFWANQTVVAAGAKSGVMSFSGNTGFLFYTDNNGPNWGFRVFHGTGRTYLVDTTGPANEPNTWYHVVGVFDGAFVHIYVNGVENVAPLPIGGSGYVPNTTAPLRIAAGNPAGGASLFFPGWMDDVAIYPRALTATQIAAHYAAATTNAPGYAAQILADSPTGYWRLDEPILPPEPVATPNTVTNLGSWSAAANGTFYAGDMNTGTPGVPYPGFGINNTAGLFTGAVGSYIEIPPQNVAPVSALTITCWAKRNGVSDFWNMIYSHPNDLGLPTAGASVPVTGIGFGDSTLRNNQRGFYKGDTANTGNYGWEPSPSILMPEQEWTFLAMTVDATNNMVIYQNGNSVTNNTAYGTHDFSTVASFIGKKQKYFGFGGGEVNGFRGTIDEVAIFDQALTKAQILQLLDAAQVPPLILVQPQAPPPPVYEGTPLSLFVVADVASSTTPLAYQWTKNGIAIPGQTATNYTVSSLATGDSGSYAVVLNNTYGAVTSSIVALTVMTGPPVFVQAPQAIQRFAGGTATFTTTASGSPPLSYQWSFNDISVPGATASSYTVSGVGAGDVGNYSVLVTNPYGSTNSAAAALTILPVSGAYAAEVAAGGAVSYWRFNETSGTTANDYMGGVNGVNVAMNYGTNGPLPTSSPTHFVGMENNNKAYNFNGASEVRLPKSFALNRDAFSIVAWVRADTAAPFLNIMAQGGNLWRFHLNDDASKLELVTPGLSGAALVGMISVVDGVWHQVAAVYDGARKYIYVDGALDISASSGGLLRTNADIVTIGSQGDFRWNGDLDEVAVYGRGLSETEVVNLYRAATSAAGAPQIVTQPISQTVFAGQPASLSVAVLGGAPYTYQWKHAGTNLPGATKQTLTIPSAFYTDAGTYSVTVTGAATPPATSQTATLTVVVPPELTLFANVTNALVLHLKFDGNFLDVSGRNNNGTAQGTVPGPTFVAGKIGNNAVHVDSEADLSGGNPVCTNANYVTLGEPPDLRFGADTNFTVAYWVKIPAREIYTEFPVLCNSFGGTFSPGMYFGTDWNDTSPGEGGGAAWWISSPGKHLATTTCLTGPYFINDGNWHHLLFSFDRTAYAVTYLDGVPIDSTSIVGGGDLDLPGQVFNIGQDTTGTYPWFGLAGPKAEAVIDDFGIWRRALSPTEAESIYLVGQNFGRSFDSYGPVKLTFQLSGAGFDLIWQAGTLQESDTVNGTYLPVASAPYYHVTPSAAKKFYRVRL